jgi:hypothetical protein
MEPCVCAKRARREEEDEEGEGAVARFEYYDFEYSDSDEDEAEEDDDEQGQGHARDANANNSRIVVDAMRDILEGAEVTDFLLRMRAVGKDWLAEADVDAGAVAQPGESLSALGLRRRALVLEALVVRTLASPRLVARLV